MSSRVLLSTALVAAALAAGCREQAPIPHTPTHLIIVSGGNQSGDLSASLALPLVVQALDGANRSVAGVPVAWTVTGGGSVSAATGTTDNDGKATVTWTLAPATGVQVVTVTSTQISTASVSFVANNGAVISGTVTSLVGTPFGASFSRTVSRSSRAAPARTVTRHPSSNRIVIGFKDAALGLAAIGSSTYRSMATARQAKGLLQQRVSTLARAHGLTNAEVSPALVAARVRVTDTTQIDAVMEALRADPNVAWVERDQIVSIRDGAPRPMAALQLSSLDPRSAIGTSAIVGKVPNDPGFFEQLWSAQMLDLPRAWAITTGSPSVIVASVDMGIRFDHQDIAANLTSDGYDFVSQIGYGTTEKLCDGTATFTTIEGDGDGPDPDPTDPDDLEFVVGATGDPFDDPDNCWAHSRLGDHGLWTAGIIGAIGNEGAGIAGVNWSVKIRPIRVLGITGDGSDFDIAQGVLYAAGLPATGADTAIVQAPSRAPIISMSLGGGFPSNTLGSAVAAASAAGSLIVASAGNDGLDFPVFPAAYPNVMAVASVGMDGALATYSNAGTFVSVAAPGGDFRLDDNGGGGVLGPGWNFESGRPTFLFGYGTSASAPFVSGIAALMLAKEPGLTAQQMRSRIEQFATRPAGFTRSDALGWGIVNAYNALTQQNGPPRQTLVRLVDATTGALVKSTKVGSDGSFAFTRLATGSYFVQAGDDESSDGAIGVVGRRFAWAGGFGKPTVFNVNTNSQAVAIALGIPTEVEPNDDIAHANALSVGSYVTGNITTPDIRDIYSVTIPAAGTYTFETSGLVGSCGLGIELDTFLTLSSAVGTATIGTNNDSTSPTGRFCSRIQATLTPGIYYVTVNGSGANGLASHGRYRLEVRSGT
jgi:hypothetical protein